MPFTPIPVWRQAPFIRMLVPYIAGILIQWYLKLPVSVSCYGAIATLFFLALFSLKDIPGQFKRYWIQGVLLNCWLFFAGLLITFTKDASNHPLWITKAYAGSETLIATLDEPLSKKAKSFKTVASVQVIHGKDTLIRPEGKVIIYLQRDTITPDLKYGNKILFNKKLQPIVNTGNPGSFDYKRYCAFQQIYYQVYLNTRDYKVLPEQTGNNLKQVIFRIRKAVIDMLRNSIRGSKESGLAEALLIGYKDDLDKGLVQSYTNTGVVHVIAISGLHVGLIYCLLTYVLNPLSKRKSVKWLKPLLVITGLWVFSLLAGGSPSVLRSAVMFTTIVLGESISRKTCVYSSLSASAFMLLCYNPFWLWDVGFQLSYAAVLSIVVFMKPIYNWWFIHNKWLDAIWKLNTVTLSAQVLTVPICLYYFHQFPSFFLVTNLIAVPLSSIILIVELILCLASPMPVIAKAIGWVLYWLIRVMNTFIEYMDSLPFSVVENIQISSLQVICLYVIIISIAVWLFKKAKHAFILALIGLLVFGLERFNTIITTHSQKRLIVYNIPNHNAIDFVDGHNYVFKGDSTLLGDNFLENFHLKPSRIMQRIKPADSLRSLVCDDVYFHFAGRNILILDKQLPSTLPSRKIIVDIIVFTGNLRISIPDLHKLFSCRQIVFDASNSVRRITKWRAECDSLRIRYYSVPDKGAFVVNMN